MKKKEDIKTKKNNNKIYFPFQPTDTDELLSARRNLSALFAEGTGSRKEAESGRKEADGSSRKAHVSESKETQTDSVDDEGIAFDANVLATVAKAKLDGTKTLATVAKGTQDEDKSIATVTQEPQNDAKAPTTFAKESQDDAKSLATIAKVTQEDENVMATVTKGPQDNENTLATVANFARKDDIKISVTRPSPVREVVPLDLSLPPTNQEPEVGQIMDQSDKQRMTLGESEGPVSTYDVFFFCIKASFAKG